MGKITALQLSKSKKRVSVFLSDSSSFIIDRNVAEEVGLRKGLDLSIDQVKELLESDLYHRCFDAAVHLLAYRPRSELEMKQRLYKRGFRDDIASKTLLRLREQNLINDEAFAQYWKDTRLSFNPRSRRLIKYELMRKGIPSETADEATSDLDDTAAAYKAGLKKARLISSMDYGEFRRRLSNYLKWRGFSYEIIDNVSERLWQEKQDASKQFVL
jgi:regulatory protein